MKNANRYGGCYHGFKTNLFYSVRKRQGKGIHAQAYRNKYNVYDD